MPERYDENKRKVGIFLIRVICILFIISGIAGFIAVCNGDGVSRPDSANDHSYKDVSQAEGTEGVLYSLGVICVGGVGLLLTKRRNGFEYDAET